MVEGFRGFSRKEEKSSKEFLLFFSYSWNNILPYFIVNGCWFTSIKRERATFGWFQSHSHGIDIIVDVVDEVLMGSFVGGD